MNRRGFLFGIGSLLAAPAIVRAGSLMPVKTLPGGEWVIDYTPHMQGVWKMVNGHLECVMEPGGGSAGTVIPYIHDSLDSALRWQLRGYKGESPDKRLWPS